MNMILRGCDKRERDDIGVNGVGHQGTGQLRGKIVDPDLPLHQRLPPFGGRGVIQSVCEQSSERDRMCHWLRAKEADNQIHTVVVHPSQIMAQKLAPRLWRDRQSKCNSPQPLDHRVSGGWLDRICLLCLGHDRSTAGEGVGPSVVNNLVLSLRGPRWGGL